jgi:L-2-hydroxyglutarate oxidase LhgO
VAATRIGVVGAGIVGLAIARRLGEAVADAQITVLEKEDRVAAHQTGHNSGVVHAGVYYTPGSLKAKLCRRGVELLKPFCEQREIAYVECGKLIVALNGPELDRLDEIERRGNANGVPGLKRLDRGAMREIEPYVEGVSALHSPHTAIVDFSAVALAYADDVSERGGVVRLGFEVAAIGRINGEIRVKSASGEELAFDRLVICGGLQSDRLAELTGEDSEPSIIPFRGEYYRLVAARRDLVRGLIYPVPDPAYPFLGVHFTRRVDGGVEIGPNAVLAFAREGYARTDFSFVDLTETLTSPGFRKLARKHWKMGAKEMWGSFSRRAFVGEARKYLPMLTVADVEPAGAGVRAQAIDRNGSLVDDFRISAVDGIVLVRNAPSPAATSSMAIAEYVIDEVYARA